MVSVIIPFFRRTGTLAWTVSSVLRQTYQDFEIILVNDIDPQAEDDGCAHLGHSLARTWFFQDREKWEHLDAVEKGEFVYKRIVEGKSLEEAYRNFYKEPEKWWLRYAAPEANWPDADPRITFILKKNEGIASAHNMGVTKSKGDLLLFLDSDDWIEPTFLEKTIALMKPGIGFVSTDMHVFSENSDSVVKTKVVTLDEEVQGNKIPLCSLMRREAYFEINGQNTADVYEDWEMWISMLEEGWKMAVVNEPLFHYRHHVRESSAIVELTKRHDKLMENMRRLHPGLWG